MAGRKMKIKTAKQMQRLIDDYFTSCKGELLKDSDGSIVTNKFGEPIYLNSKPPTVTGLAYALGLKSRQALLNYQERKEFTETIERAKLRIEQYAEERLFDREGTKGAQFTLQCNFRWNPENEEKADNMVNIILPGAEAEK